jgi:hypothetical protein
MDVLKRQSTKQDAWAIRAQLIAEAAKQELLARGDAGILDIDTDGLLEVVGAASIEHDDRPPFRFYRLHWENGDWCEIVRNGDWLEFKWLQSNDGGLLTKLVSTLPGYFRERGIATFVTVPHAPSDDAMRKVGFVHGTEHASGYLICDTSEGGRMDQYAAFKRGEAPEPEWRKPLTEEEK